MNSTTRFISKCTTVTGVEGSLGGVQTGFLKTVVKQ